jgi:hypothetical protein
MALDRQKRFIVTPTDRNLILMSMVGTENATDNCKEVKCYCEDNTGPVVGCYLSTREMSRSRVGGGGGPRMNWEAYVQIRVSNKSRVKFKDKIQELTRRNNALSIYQVIQDLNKYLQGWAAYFRIQEFKE